MAKVALSSEVAAAPELLWRTLKGFSAVAEWNPLVRSVEAEGDAVGSTRVVVLEGAGRFVERLESLDDGARRYGYAILESPLPVRNCTVEVRVTDNGDGTATVQWTSRFDAESPAEFKAVRTFQRLYQNALDNLHARFAPHE